MCKATNAATVVARVSAIDDKTESTSLTRSENKKSIMMNKNSL